MVAKTFADFIKNSSFALKDKILNALARAGEYVDEACRNRMLEALKLARLEACGLSGDEVHKTFENFTIDGESRSDRESQHAALWLAKKFADRFPDVDCGLYVAGPPGTGKDHLLCAIVHRLVDRGLANIKYIHAFELIAAGSAGYDKLDEIVNSAVASDLVVISDLPVALAGKEVVAQATRLIICEADSVGSPVICASSNYSLAQLEEILDSPALISRMYGLFCEIWLPGVDKRRRRTKQ